MVRSCWLSRGLLQFVRRSMLAVALAAGTAGAAAQTVAVVVEAGRGVDIRTGGALSPALMLQTVEAGAELVLQPGARAVLLYVRSGDEYTLEGPCRARAGGAQMVPIDGTAPRLRRPSPGAEIRLRPERLAQGGVRLRSARAEAAPTAEEIERRRPAAGAGVAARVAYALWLEQRGLAEAAGVAWRALAVDSPEQPLLADRAAR